MFQVRVDTEGGWTGTWQDNVDLHTDSLDVIFNEVSALGLADCGIEVPVRALPEVCGIIEATLPTASVFDTDFDIDIHSFAHDVLKLAYSVSIRWEGDQAPSTRKGIITIMPQN